MVEPGGTAFGGAGLVEMPTARMRRDGVVEFGASLRSARHLGFVAWQALPWLEVVGRVNDRWDRVADGARVDASMDLRMRVWQEGDVLPALAIGLRDVGGRGAFRGEFMVASKRFWGVDLSVGMGWGRLASGRDVPNPLAAGTRFLERRPDGVEGVFRGAHMGLFGGAEWVVPPVLGLDGLRARVEYSADALRDDGTRQRHRVNAALAWQNENVEVSAGVVGGRDALLRLSARLDPANVPQFWRAPVPQMLPRPEPVAGWSNESVAASLFPALRAAGLQPVALEIRGVEAVLTVGGQRYRTMPQMAGRLARAAQPHLPSEVERIRLVWEQEGVVIGRLVAPRAGFEAAQNWLGSAEEIFAGAQVLPAASEAGGVRTAWPRYAWDIEPRLSLFAGDVGAPLRYQMGVAMTGRVALGAGVSIAGSVQQSVVQNLQGAPLQVSALPRVRSDAPIYAREGRTSIPTLYAEGLRNLAPDWYARATVGLLEPMFAGASGEVLWRPQAGSVAVGLDLAWVRQRGYAQRFAFLPYRAVTGHASVYWDTPWWDVYAVARAGRHLGGDWGGTLELGRRFANGIEAGGYVTATNARGRGGEAGVDGGVFLRLPLDAFGLPVRTVTAVTVRPSFSDVGQRLVVDSPLWRVTREGTAESTRRAFMGFMR
ncbi:MAG: YjbH domain-containing protein [Alphaproteobacteria bacterium]|nr:YjbH domain-containing protein [Alphaproteobacteria bacterium]